MDHSHPHCTKAALFSWRYSGKVFVAPIFAMALTESRFFPKLSASSTWTSLFELVSLPRLNAELFLVGSPILHCMALTRKAYSLKPQAQRPKPKRLNLNPNLRSYLSRLQLHRL